MGIATEAASFALLPGSADELLYVVRPEPDVRVVPAAHLDLGKNVFVAGLTTLVVQIDHGPADVEERDHFGAILGHDQRVGLAGWLVDEASFLRDPVVLEIAPAPL